MTTRPIGIDLLDNISTLTTKSKVYEDQNKSCITFGRESSCDVQLNAFGVSKKHLEIDFSYRIIRKIEEKALSY